MTSVQIATAPSRPSARTALPTFRAIYDAHFSFVFTNLRRFGVPDEALEDGTHDVFIVVHRRILEFEGRSSVRTWLFGIVRRIAFRHRRGQDRRDKKAQALATVASEPADLDEHVKRREAGELLGAFLAELDEERRAVFVLGELEQLGRREIGAALGINPNTAYSRLRSAQAAFARTFAEQDPRKMARLLRRARPPKETTRAAHRRVLATLAVQLPLATTATTVTTASAWLTPLKTLAVTAGLAAFCAGAIHIALGVEGVEGVERRTSHPVSEPASRLQSQSKKVPSSPAAITQPAPLPTPPQKPAVPADRVVAPSHETRAARFLSPDRRKAASETKTSHEQPQSPSSADALVLVAEEKLMRRARSALRRGDALMSLALLGEHARRYERGVFATERGVTRVVALCRLGRVTAARAQAETLRHHPTKRAHLEQIQKSCVGDSINPLSRGDQEK